MDRQKIIALLIALLPIASIYKFPILINNLGHALMLFIIFPLAMAEFMKRKPSITKDVKKYCYFSGYLLMISVIMPLIGGYGSNIKSMLMFVEYTFFLLLIVSCIQYTKSFFRYYVFFAEIFSWFLLLQILLAPLGIHQSGFIPFLEFYDSEAEFTSVDEGRMLRAASVFTEPSHFALYVAPVLALSLWQIKGITAMRRIIVITVAILLSGSGNGVIMAAVIYFVYVIQRYFSKKSISLYFVGSAILLASVVLIPRTSYFRDVTHGLFVTEYDTSVSRADTRVYRGFLLYTQEGVREMITGIGWRDAENYFSSKNSSLYNLFYIENFEYFNSIAGILIYSGVIGLILFLWFFFSLWKQIPFGGYRLLIIVIIVPMFSSSVFMMEQWPLYMFSLYSTKQYAQSFLVKKVV